VQVQKALDTIKAMAFIKSGVEARYRTTENAGLGNDRLTENNGLENDERKNDEP